MHCVPTSGANEYWVAMLRAEAPENGTATRHPSRKGRLDCHVRNDVETYRGVATEISSSGAYSGGWLAALFIKFSIRPVLRPPRRWPYRQHRDAPKNRWL